MIACKRLTSQLKVTGTTSFRLASSKLLGYYGTNLQNPTDTLMECVCAPPGRKFVQPDQAGAEALVVAMECRVGRYRKLFDLGIKVHSYMALQLFTDLFRGSLPADRYRKVDPELFAGYPELKDLLRRISDSPDEYYLGKKTIHSFSYDQGWRTFQLVCLVESEGRIRLTPTQSKGFKGEWQETFPEISEWQVETCAEVAASKDHHGNYTIRNLQGYPITFNRIWTDEFKRQLLAMRPQSTVATITNLAYTELYQRIQRERLPWQLLNNKHDSLLIEIPDTTEHTEMSIDACRTHMGRELTSSRGEVYRMKVGISTGYNWGHWHETHNPTGLRELR